MPKKSPARKALLVVTFIAAFILGIIIVAPQKLQALNPYAEQKQDANSNIYTVEIVSTEVVDEYVSNGVKIQLQKQTVKLTDKPTYEELVALNQEYFDFLIAELGEEGERIVEQKKQEIREGIANSEEQFEIDVVVMQ